MGRLELVEIYIVSNVDVNTLINGETPLYRAIINGNWVIANELIKSGADVKYSYKQFDTNPHGRRQRSLRNYQRTHQLGC